MTNDYVSNNLIKEEIFFHSTDWLQKFKKRYPSIFHR